MGEKVRTWRFLKFLLVNNNIYYVPTLCYYYNTYSKYPSGLLMILDNYLYAFLQPRIVLVYCELLWIKCVC